MGLHIHLEKKNLYIILAVIAISIVLYVSTIFAFAGHGDGTQTPWIVKGTYHFLQQVVKDDTVTSVDYNNNGLIDDSDDVTCTGCVINGEIANSAVNSVKIADGQVQTDDLADGSVTTAKILDGNVQTGDIADGAVTLAKVNFNYAGSSSKGGIATSASALAANGANCVAGSYPLGVDAAGTVESCTAIPDTSSTNELQTLGTSGNTVTLSNGGSITVPYATSAGSANNAYACSVDATCEMQAGSITGNLNVGGNVVVTGTITSTGGFFYSDERLKTNINEIPNAVEKIQQLNGYSFEWKKDGRKDIGLLAQDVEKVYPELVSTDPDTGYKSVEYANLVAVLIEAVKEQQKDIDALKQQIENCQK